VVQDLGRVIGDHRASSTAVERHRTTPHHPASNLSVRHIRRLVVVLYTKTLPSASHHWPLGDRVWQTIETCTVAAGRIHPDTVQLV
jgi:hypothetical protein